jgi:hypothetical protein
MARQNIDLIPYDFESHAKTMIEYLRVNLPNDYQDFLESNAARVLIDAVAYEISLLAFMVNANLKQMFIPTATTRKAMFLMGKLVNYDLRGKVPSDVLVTFFIDAIHPKDIIIPQGTQVQAPGQNPVIFETTIEVTLQAGQLSVSVSAKQGVTVENETIGTTSPASSPNQQFLSTRPPLIDTLTLTINNISWSKVDNIFDLSPGELGFTAKPDENGLAIITFGNGVFGAIPPANQDVVVTYRVGGGANTNVTSGTITEIIGGTIHDTDNIPITTIKVVNAEGASGGQDEESIEEARVNIPRSVRSMDRFVSREDFQKIPQLFEDAVVGSIFKSNATVRYLWAVHVITIYCLGHPNSGRFQPPAVPSQALLDALRVYIEERTLPTIAISTEPARLFSVNIIGKVYYLANYREETVRNNVLDALDTLVFGNSVREIGDGLRLSDVYAAIDNAIGVDYCTLTSPTGNVNVLGDEYVVPGTIDLLFFRINRA